MFKMIKSNINYNNFSIFSFIDFQPILLFFEKLEVFFFKFYFIIYYFDYFKANFFEFTFFFVFFIFLFFKICEKIFLSNIFDFGHSFQLSINSAQSKSLVLVSNSFIFENFFFFLQMAF